MSAQNPQPLPPEVITALKNGKLIEAIKLMRAMSGNIDLAQAKKAIEQHLDRSKVAKATVGEAFGSLAQIPAVADALRKGNKIEAIRVLRAKTGLGLKEAKDAIDRFSGNDSIDGASPSASASASTHQSSYQSTHEPPHQAPRP